MRHPYRILSAVILSAALGMLAPALGAGTADTMRFGSGVQITATTTPQDVLLQSQNASSDGTVAIGGRRFAFDRYGHAMLAQPDRGVLCRWLGLLCPELPLGDIAVTREAAKDIVIATVIPSLQQEMEREAGRVLPILGFSWPKPLAAGTVVFQDTAMNAPLNVFEDAWFFFIDLEPHAYFGHRAEMVLVDAKNGSVLRKRVFSPPVIDGTTRYLSLDERWRSEDRFYPTSLDRMPAAGSWPLHFASPTAKPRHLAPPVPTDPLADVVVPPSEGTWVSWTIPSAAADSPTITPCNGTGKKVAVLISGESPDTQHSDGLVDGEDMAHSQAAVRIMLRNLGFQNRDVHTFDPGRTPKLDDVFADIERIAAGLGPCDKLLFYVFGHGTIVDENDDDIPDSPSDSIAYGHGAEKEYMSKSRWGEHSLLELLERLHVGRINLMIESCYSGSFDHFIQSDVANPAVGSTWNVLLASSPDKPSYGHGDRPAAYYTEELAYCVNLKLAQRGIQNPSIEQIESLMKECQDALAAAPETYLAPMPTKEITRTNVSVSSDVVIKEGDSGTRFAEFVVTRTPADRPITMEYRTYDPGADDASVPFASRKDYEWSLEGKRLELAAGVASITIRIPITGDRIPEDDEVFGVWFLNVGAIRKVTIVDDDRPDAPAVSPASSSARTSSASSSRTTASVPPITVEPGALDAFGQWLLETIEKEEEATHGDEEMITIDPKGWDLSWKPLGETYGMGIRYDLQTDCPDCEKERAAAAAKQAECAELAAKAGAAAVTADDSKRAADAAADRLREAQAALDRFENPRSWAESNGRRTDTADLEIVERYGRSLWERYRTGAIDAQQLSDAWNTGLNDSERQRLREEFAASLRAAVTSAAEAAETAAASATEQRSAAQNLSAQSIACDQAFTALRTALSACEERCVPVLDMRSASATSIATTSVSRTLATASSQRTQSVSRTASLWLTSETTSSSSKKTTSLSAAPERCDASTFDAATCAATCEDAEQGSCEKVYRRNDGQFCFRCTPKREDVSCPSGMTPDGDACDDACAEAGGSCERDGDCYRCVVHRCPENSFASCPSSCTNGCNIAAQNDAITCYRCAQTCEEICASRDYARAGSDWSDWLSSALKEYSCVSGATFSIDTATFGSCTCSNPPSFSVNTAVPVCSGTTCGDVACGQSATCSEGDATVTVRCAWQGWKNTGVNQFQPAFGE